MEVKGQNISINGQELTYLKVPYHRDGTVEKSQWTISENEEVDCFIESIQKKWSNGETNFGLRRNENDDLIYLGRNRFGEDLLIAKFVNNSSNWHGYPSDYIRNTHDIPNYSTLIDWRDRNLIRKSQMLKIKQGKPCNL